MLTHEEEEPKTIQEAFFGSISKELTKAMEE